MDNIKVAAELIKLSKSLISEEKISDKEVAEMYHDVTSKISDPIKATGELISRLIKKGLTIDEITKLGPKFSMLLALKKMLK